MSHSDCFVLLRHPRGEPFLALYLPPFTTVLLPLASSHAATPAIPNLPLHRALALLSALLLLPPSRPLSPRHSPALTSPTRSGLSSSVDVPSGARCPHTYNRSSFQSPLASLGFVPQASSALGPPSWPFNLERFTAIPFLPSSFGWLVSYIHLLAVCLSLGPFPPCLPLWPLMPPSALTRELLCPPFTCLPSSPPALPPSDSHPRMHDPQGQPISSISEECFWVFFWNVFGFVFVWSRPLLTLRCSDRPPLGSMPQPPRG